MWPSWPSEVYESIRHRAAVTASARLDTAKFTTDYQKIIDKFPDAPAAANAYLLLGRRSYENKDYAGAVKAWQAFADKYPQSLLAPSALVGAGGALETMGKLEEARTAYQKAATSYPKSYVAPLARLDEASLLKSQRKLEDARRVYEDILANYPQSDVIQQVQAQLASLKSLPPLTATAAPATAASGSPAEFAPAPGVGEASAGSPVGTATTPVMSPNAAATVHPGVVPRNPAAVDAAAALGAPEPVLPRSAVPAGSSMPVPAPAKPTPNP